MRWWQWAAAVAAVIAAAALTPMPGQTSSPDHGEGSTVSNIYAKIADEKSSTDQVPLNTPISGPGHTEHFLPPGRHGMEQDVVSDFPGGMPPPGHGTFKSIYSDPGHMEQHHPPPAEWFDGHSDSEHHPPPDDWLGGRKQGNRNRAKESIPELGCSHPNNDGCVAVHAALDWSRVEFDHHNIFEKAMHDLRAPKSPTVGLQTVQEKHFFECGLFRACMPFKLFDDNALSVYDSSL